MRNICDLVEFFILVNHKEKSVISWGINWGKLLVLQFLNEGIVDITGNESVRHISKVKLSLSINLLGEIGLI